MTTPLFIRSYYSLLSSLIPINQLVNKARENGYTAVGLVDKNVLAGAMTFKKECEKAGIKPIYGLEVEIDVLDRLFSTVLYAKNDNGFKNLMALSSYVCTSNNNKIDEAVLKKYQSDNFIVLLSDDMPLTSVIDKNGDIDECLTKQKEIFGDYLIGLVDNNLAINNKRNNKLKEVCQKNNIKTLALSRTFYLEKDDYKEYEVLKCIRDKRLLDKNVVYEEGRYFLNKNEYASLYSEDDLKNCDVLASLCNVNLEYKTSLPKYQTPNGVDSKEYLIALCKEGLRRRLKGKVTKEYSQRLEYELKVIIKMNFEDYFLIVYDFILFAKKNGIFVGPGRGSAAGSLATYCLGITDIDPLKYNLLFERFLNPERITMPDIDTDFPDDRRQELFDYVKEKYGRDHVSHIITYGTLKAKQVIRDVGRVLNYSTSEIDGIAKLVPNTLNITLMEAYNTSKLFKQKIDSEQKYRDFFKICLKLEGFPRHASTHAAGVVMSNLKLEEVVPVIEIESDTYSTQYTMEHLEGLGLIKMDFLGLRNLGIIAEIVDDINSKVPFNIKDIPLDDPKTFKLIDDVNLLGVFQLESTGMQNLARKMKPRTFEELGMMIALFRPGPMENIPEFLNNRANPSRIKYLVPELKPILEDTYGIIIYQEQIMSIARTLAGFTYGKADILRRAMSKKKLSELTKLEDDFINGCISNGYSKEIANNLYALILKFANYGFNKSHSIAYGMVAYELAYLKANYPLYFYKALLNGVIGSESKTHEYIMECKSIGQNIKGISINHSDLLYTIDNNSIIMPLSICKDVGRISAEKIINERNNSGEFKDFVSTICRLNNVGVEVNVLENLIYAGALDELGLTRHAMINALPNTLKYASANKGNISLIDEDEAPIIENLKDDKLVRAENEKNVLGFYFSFNPILEVKKNNGITCDPIRNISNKMGPIKGFGLINRVKPHKTKKGDMMCFVDLIDDSGDMSLVVMPNLYKDLEDKLVKGKYVYFEGKVDKESSALVNKVRII